MFRFVPNKTFTTTAKLHVAGSETPGEIKATFKYKDPEELALWQKSFGEKTVVEALFEVMENWGDIEDVDGAQVPFNHDNLKALCTKYHSAGSNLTQAYIRELYGARLKN